MNARKDECTAIQRQPPVTCEERARASWLPDELHSDHSLRNAALTEPFAVRALRDLEFDAFQRWSPRADGDFAVKVAAIDDESISRLGQWPWPREIIANLIEKLSRAGAATVILDVLF